MKNDNSYTVFFDLDRTVLDMNSGYALGITAYKDGIMRKTDMIYALLMTLLYKLNLRSAEKMITGMGIWLRGLTVETVSALAKKAVDKYLIKSVYQEFRDELLFHGSHNARTAFLTSVISEICQPLSSELGIGSIICTEMECNEGIYSGFPAGNYCYGGEKAIRMEEFCRKNGIDLLTSYYYADSISDLPALELSGNPVCINPDSKLKRIALKRGWKIMYWKRKAGKLNHES